MTTTYANHPCVLHRIRFQVFEAAAIPIEWEEHHIGTVVDPRTNSFVTKESLDSVLRNRIGLKGPMTTPIGKGFRCVHFLPCSC